MKENNFYNNKEVLILKKNKVIGINDDWELSESSEKNTLNKKETI